MRISVNFFVAMSFATALLAGCVLEGRSSALRPAAPRRFCIASPETEPMVVTRKPA